MQLAKHTVAALFTLLFSAAIIAAETDKPSGLPAEVVRVEPQRLDISLDAVGTLLANEAVTLRPERTGRVLGIHFSEGRPIKRGQKLFTLESSTEVAALRQVEAGRDLSQVEYNQAEQLLQRKLGSRHERDKALAQLNIDEARVNLARTALEKMTLYAPFDGYAGLRRVSVGDYVSDGQPLVDLVDIEQLKLDFQLPEKHLPLLSPGMRVSLTTEALPEEQFEGKIYAIAPQIDPRSRSVSLRALIDNGNKRLLPGLFARVNLLLETRDATLMIPEQAIIPRGRDFFVYRVTDNKVENLKVSLGVRRQGLVEVVEGINPGDVIITAGQMKLQPGGPVTPVFPAEDGAEKAE
ncbi:efflux RND transporter periplasmic adaptor subunit [Motiliproteus sediminis]|uniref:efflux RND transporter periplasmic adaptor subunit n=1 Tax=Motiliproteus sediminis TaxID=1468178 RepID=UPI001AEFE4A8|nr:efflux RND transporter periplasmic adaptor subunit [Motiliproteus sediminis]